MLGWLRKRRRRADAATKLYNDLVARARDPEFYRTCGVPDSMLGRFEMICLHAFILFRRLGKTDNEGRELAQAVHDLMFADLDRTLREQGIGDMGIGKRVKKLAKNLYGRIGAYDSGLAGGAGELAAALKRNLYATADVSDAEIGTMIRYVHAAVGALEEQPVSEIMAGNVTFPAVDLAARQPAAAGAGQELRA